MLFIVLLLSFGLNITEENRRVSVATISLIYLVILCCLYRQGHLSSTTKALFPQLPPFPLPSPSPRPSLPSPIFPSCCEAAPLKPARVSGVGSAVSSPSGVWGEAPADIDFGVF